MDLPTQIANQTVNGLGLGGSFALAALGIVLVYRVTGVLNFANGAIGMFATFVAYQIENPWHKPVWMAVLGALGFAILLGLALENLVFRWLTGRTALVKAVVTIGLLLVLQAAASLIWGNNQYHTAIDLINCPKTSTCAVTIGLAHVAYGRILIVVAALGLALSLAALLKFSRIGIAMRAVSESPVAARLWGVPVNVVGSLSWVIGCVVAAIAAILITPFINLDTVSLTVLILDALAAALIGGLVSLPMTVLGGFVLGLLETYPSIWTSSQGFSKLVALAVIVAVLILRRQRGIQGASAE